MLRVLSRTPFYLAKLPRLTGKYSLACVDGLFIVPPVGLLEQDPMIPVLRAIEQHCGRFAYVERHNVHLSIVVEVTESGAAARCPRNRAQTRSCGNICKHPVTQIAEQLHRLTIFGPCGNSV